MRLEPLLKLLYNASTSLETLFARVRLRDEPDQNGATTHNRAETDYEQIFKLWLNGPTRAREEHERGVLKGRTIVTNGATWASIGPGNAYDSNAGNPNYLAGAEDRYGILIEPASLLGALRFGAIAPTTLIGRQAIHASGVPRPRCSAIVLESIGLGWGATSYSVTVDAASGLLLALKGATNDRVVFAYELLEVEIDPPISSEMFRLPDAPRPAAD